MPTFILYTNTRHSSEVIDDIHTHANQILSSVIGKSSDFVLTLVNPDLSMKFGRNNEPCAYVEIKNVGSLDSDQTTAISRKICHLIDTELGIEINKTYIEFQESSRHLWGWNGKTFAK